MCDFCGCDDKRIVGAPSNKRKSAFTVIKIESGAVGEDRNITGSDARPSPDAHEGQKLAEQTEAEPGQPAAVE